VFNLRKKGSGSMFLGSQPTHIGNSTVDFRKKKNKGQLNESIKCELSLKERVFLV
jgi:hypothetical protein